MFNFARLNKRSVRFDNGDGTSFDSPMLPIEKLPDYKAIINAIDSEIDLTKRMQCREQLIAMAQTVFPADRAHLLERCDLTEAVQVTTYLMYGWGDDDDDKKKAEVTE